jgi:hypothetical protein
MGKHIQTGFLFAWCLAIVLAFQGCEVAPQTGSDTASGQKVAAATPRPDNVVTPAPHVTPTPEPRISITTQTTLQAALADIGGRCGINYTIEDVPETTVTLDVSGKALLEVETELARRHDIRFLRDESAPGEVRVLSNRN